MPFPPIIPNPRSKHKTPLSVQVELRYAELGIIGRWDWQRYLRLAQFLNLTVYELASHICWTHRGVDEACEKNRFPGPVCFLLTIFEAQLMSKFTDDVVPNLNPFDYGPPKDT